MYFQRPADIFERVAEAPEIFQNDPRNPDDVAISDDAQDSDFKEMIERVLGLALLNLTSMQSLSDPSLQIGSFDDDSISIADLDSLSIQDVEHDPNPQFGSYFEEFLEGIVPEPNQPPEVYQDFDEQVQQEVHQDFDGELRNESRQDFDHEVDYQVHPQVNPRTQSGLDQRLAEITVGPHDILTGQSPYLREHIGNKALRRLIEGYAPEYFHQETKKSRKTEICISILQTIRGNGGRFLRRIDNRWEEIDNFKRECEIIGSRFRGL
eukprot:CAMPEP_0116122900 /NCGR_PEP_ID=MMETSP0329-20121206/4460_1 /TAXON_ID=697910 /ORGANISM="Pseudo-nitzschia arenysensis, Strain B593" /LENGTH=265 /DNA_ID=CAMNT_0003616777 /DNA_START=100 /DNA_END=893 /DNA_ORIENTATION=-